MTQKEIVAIATQAAIAAVQGIINAQNGVQVSNNKRGGNAKSSSKPKALPDATSATIGDIMAEAQKESVTNGKTYEVEANKATIMEYSELTVAIYGDTKTRRDILKKYGGEKTTRFGTIHTWREDKCQGWFLSKKKIEENGGMKKMLAELKKAGLSVSQGESLRAAVEKWRAEHPYEKKENGERTKENGKKGGEKSASSNKKGKDKPAAKKDEPKAKVVPISVETFEGVGYECDGTSGTYEFTKYPDNPDLYVRKNDKGKELLYVCIGEKNGVDAFLFIAPKNGDIPAPVKHTAKEGILTAIADGTIKNVLDYVVAAFKDIDDQEGYNWLVQSGYAEAA